MKAHWTDEAEAGPSNTGSLTSLPNKRPDSNLLLYAGTRSDASHRRN